MLKFYERSFYGYLSWVNLSMQPVIFVTSKLSHLSLHPSIRFLHWFQSYSGSWVEENYIFSFLPYDDFCWKKLKASLHHINMPVFLNALNELVLFSTFHTGLPFPTKNKQTLLIFLPCSPSKSFLLLPNGSGEKQSITACSDILLWLWLAFLKLFLALVFRADSQLFVMTR